MRRTDRAGLSRPSLAHLSVACAAGALHAAGFGPWPHWLLALAALSLLFAIMRRAAAQGASPAAQALLAAAFAMSWFGVGLSWLYVSMHDVGGMPAPMAAAAVVLFSAYLSLYPAAASWLAWRGLHAPGPWQLAFRLAGAWTLAEMARGWVMTGFPWLAIGYGQIDGPLDGIAPLAGVYGIGALTVAVAALVAWALPCGRDTDHAVDVRRAAQAVAAAVGLACLPLASSPAQWTHATGPTLSVRLLQGNVPQALKFDPERAQRAMRDYLAGFESGTATLTILPETAWTVPWNYTPEALTKRIETHVARGHAVAIGMPLLRTEPGSSAPRPTNSVTLFAAPNTGLPTPEPAVYDKRHLVPFGEFVPLGFRWFVQMMHIPLGDFGRGASTQRPFTVGGQRVAFNICYEDLFGEEIIDAVRGASGATILANVSNIGWFGRSHALPQHLQISRMRALETGRPMLRATNTGMTALIDAQGRVVAALPPHEAGLLDVQVQGTEGLTPYVRTGNLGVLVVALAALLGTATTRRRGLGG